MQDLTRLSAIEAVHRLRQGDVTPLELIDAAASRIAQIEPHVNALPTLCFDRARDHARRLMSGREAAAEDEPGWLAGLPVVIKDLTDVAGVRTTYGSPLFHDHVPAASHPLVRRIERKGGIVIGQVQHARVRRRRQHVQRGVRPHAQPLEHRPHLRRLERAAGPWRSPPGRPGWRTVRTMAGRSGAQPPCAPSSASALRPGRVDARHGQHPVLAAFGAGPDGARRAGPGAVPGHHGRVLPVRPADLRRAGPARSSIPPRKPGRHAGSPSRPIMEVGCRWIGKPGDICTRAVRRFEDAGCVVEGKPSRSWAR